LIDLVYEESGRIWVENHYPDLLLNLPSQKMFVEVKWERYAREPDIAERTRILQENLPKLGYRYELWTEREIREPPARLQNALLLLRYGRRRQVAAADRERIRLHFESTREVRWGAVRTGLFGRHGFRDVCSLILDGHLDLERLAPITDLTEIRWAGTRIRSPPLG
jgi:hypothetical protein